MTLPNLPVSTTLPMLIALNRTKPHLYAGTADPERVRRDRARNKVARQQRRANRKANARKGVR